jgi:predicted Zn finger-like uncharacterized protein
MDVQCERCRTEYEFDDALVSGRGTTVRCTHCGHQFKVRPAEGSGLAEHPWIVRVDGGPEIEFVTLRQLQQAILSKQVRRSDLLIRGGGPPRSLGSITELEPFFEGRASSRPKASGAPPERSPHSVPPDPLIGRQGATAAFAVDSTPSMVAPERPKEFYRSPSAPSVSPSSPSTLPRATALRGKVDTLRPPLTAAPAPPPASVAEAQPAALVSPEESVPVVYDETGWPSGTATEPLVSKADSQLPPPTRPVRRSVPYGEDDFASQRLGPPSPGDDSYPVPRRRGVGGWVVTLVLLFAMGVVGWAVAKPYLVAHEAGTVAAQVDPRTRSFLAEGEKAMADGSLDVAQEDFDKASALSERDSRVLLDEARIAAAKADIPWLRLRLLPPDASDDVRTTKAQFDELVVRVRHSADDALAATPDEVAAVRSKIDALRLEGDLDAARAYVSRVSGQASQPETAYVLAALDLAEPAPLWTTVIERLRFAAAAEGNAGRAQAALIYALAKSGNVSAARSELAKIDARARPYPLLPSLHAFVDRSAAPSADTSSSGTRSETAKGPVLRATPGVTGPAPVPTGPDALSADPRVAMQAAALAIKRADFVRARQIYQAIVDRNPADSEAIAGLGDVARLQGDPVSAIVAYKRAIAVNPSYLPALLGLADTEWANGNRPLAVRTYTDVIDRFPEGTYPAYVSQRNAAAAAPAPAPNGVPESAGTRAAPPSASDGRLE